MSRFKGQVAIVTGGATGIGGATARRLALEGARVLIADINLEGAKDNAARIVGSGGTAEASQVDVARAADSERMVAEIVDRWGRLDILIQNAFGVATMDPSLIGGATEISEEAWDKGIAVLAKALFLGTKFAVPQMKRQNSGNIVNLASVHGLLQTEGWLIYEAGKAAAMGMTRQMACDYGPFGIRVNCICPGHIVTEGLAKMWGDYPGGLEFFANHYPLRRTGVPDDIAGSIAFLCSDDASFITGHALVVRRRTHDPAARKLRYAAGTVHPPAPPDAIPRWH